MQNPLSILITGCSTGIGYQVAKDLHFNTDYRVIASARSAEDVARLNAQGLYCVQLDLQDSDSIKSAFEQTLEHTGGELYGLFNNGAYGQPGAVEDLSRGMLREQFETNVFGTMELTNLAIRVMRKQNSGRILFNSSVLGFVALTLRGAYNASKYALEGFADTLRLELTDTGIDISLIEPGPVATNFRSNSHAMYIKTLKGKPSVFTAAYQANEARLAKAGPAAPLTLPASAVTPKVMHALDSKRPKARYYVTVPTYFMAYLKRILTHKAMDKVLLKISQN
ncbi:MAG: short-chain dehydrogenase [Gammaproteobacteria bacterium TMED119]|nr:MAG: short-chain dehydrogenase [Gammaproteobacteria bacterium TMED119]RCL46253.1 MAG: SDR family NAD(P)-dependent oxidoreductase [Candidatus Thioglobus sp.]